MRVSSCDCPHDGPGQPTKTEIPCTGLIPLNGMEHFFKEAMSSFGKAPPLSGLHIDVVLDSNRRITILERRFGKKASTIAIMKSHLREITATVSLARQELLHTVGNRTLHTLRRDNCQC